jgi:hypothetical protein
MLENNLRFFELVSEIREISTLPEQLLEFKMQKGYQRRSDRLPSATIIIRYAAPGVLRKA